MQLTGHPTCLFRLLIRLRHYLKKYMGLFDAYRARKSGSGTFGKVEACFLSLYICRVKLDMSGMVFNSVDGSDIDLEAGMEFF